MALFRSRHDAQRSREQRALRNVRDLLDRMDLDEAAEERRQKRLVIGIIAVVAIFVLSLAIGIALHNRGLTRVEIPGPEKLPPVRAGPPPRTAPDASK